MVTLCIPPKVALGPDAGTVKVTATPLTGFPPASAMVTCRGAPNPARTTALCEAPPLETIDDGDPAVIWNTPLVAEAKFGESACSWYAPACETIRPAKTAVPLGSVFWVALPEKSFFRCRIVLDSMLTGTPAEATGFPELSTNRTVTGSVIACPATVSVGCWTNAS